VPLEEVRLVGGPGDSQTVKFTTGDDLLRWKPTDEREKITARMHGHTNLELNPVLYRRSKRTRNLFVYQP
jgi:hypothetical protein